MKSTTQLSSLHELASDYLDAWHRHDIEAILSFHTPDTVFTSGATGREAVGLDAVRETLATVFTVWPDLRFEQRRRYLTSTVIVFESTAEATQAVPLPIGDTLIEPTGTPVRFDLADVFALDDGRIARKDTYFDGLAYLRKMQAAGAVTHPIPGNGAAAGRTEARSPTPPAELAPIPARAQQMVAYTGLAYVATTRPDGQPNVSPKGSLKVLDDRTLAFGDIASPQTLENIRHHPFVEVNVVDPFRRLGFRFRGQAEIVDYPDLISFLGQGLGADYPIRQAVRIVVHETRELTSPVYWVTDVSEEDVIRIWEAKLGYYRPRADAGGADHEEATM